ncbi:TIGR04211 family SH3 domain-containing protein [Oceanicoccus sagamiensis]|uniref:Peptide-binding protein n=1 Tax=Oceanicoccus sagamiensis TaxID=716816 RepID=A0A1X9ND95_9GAMM|nr:TIGR04211 family SH3 domain-containing protein [Oceanicoccus sagamiensis]ARN75024.1 peptide-binding protein [Oceanicoccus sagamiensis]
MKNLVLWLALFAASSQLYSQTLYVSDQLTVAMRSGQSNEYRIVKYLVSGTSLTQIGTSEDGSYIQVRTRKGIEGWVQNQDLSQQPSGRAMYKTAQGTIANLEGKNSALKQQLNEISSKHASTQDKLTSLTSNNNEVSKELENIKAISANAIQLNEDNQRLLEENQMLKNEVEVLSTDNQRLVDNQESDAFLNGAFAVLIGVMITLIVPRAWPKKSTDWA